VASLPSRAKPTKLLSSTPLCFRNYPVCSSSSIPEQSPDPIFPRREP
jgi:hypothetical protein